MQKCFQPLMEYGPLGLIVMMDLQSSIVTEVAFLGIKVCRVLGLISIAYCEKIVSSFL